MASLLEGQTKAEMDRLILIQQRDGKTAALDWAKRTIKIYQDAVANPHHFAANREYRGIYEASINALQALIEKMESNGGLDNSRM